MNTDDPRPGSLHRRASRRRFDRAAGGFDEADFVHRHAEEQILERMSPMQVDVSRILDVGAAAGRASRTLARRFRRSHVISIDTSLAMLRRANAAHTRFRRISEVQADALALPLRTGSVDLVFANMLLPWLGDAATFLAATARVLRRDGLFVFSALGPDSLMELREAWGEVDDQEHVMQFADMHDLGDGLMQAGLREPVLDVDYLTLVYDDLASLFADLTAVGGRNTLTQRRRTLTGRQRFERFRRAVERRFADGKLSVRLELVFGHAWGGGPPARSGEFAFDAGSIGRRRR